MMANEHIKIGSNSYEKVNTFKYLGSILTNEISIQEEINSRLKAENFSYYLVQTLLSSPLLSKNFKIKIVIIFKNCASYRVLKDLPVWPTLNLGHN